MLVLFLITVRSSSSELMFGLNSTYFLLYQHHYFLNLELRYEPDLMLLRAKPEVNMKQISLVT